MAISSGIVQLGSIEEPIDFNGGGFDTAFWNHNSGKRAIGVQAYSAKVNSEGTPLIGFTVTQTDNQISIENPLTNTLHYLVIFVITFEIHSSDKSGQIAPSDVNMV